MIDDYDLPNRECLPPPRQLIANGRWTVPESQRPRGWEKIPLTPVKRVKAILASPTPERSWGRNQQELATERQRKALVNL